MFALPNAKRVRRDELYATSDAGSSSPTPNHADSTGDEDAAAGLFRQRMSGLLDLDVQDVADTQGATPPVLATSSVNVDDKEAGFEFNLFASAPPSDTTAKTANAPSATAPDETATVSKPRLRIRLTPPPGFDAAGYPTDYTYKKQERPLAYYLTSALDADKAEARHRQYALAALEASAIHIGATTPWPDGRILDARRPWRVSVWLPSSPATAVNGTAQAAGPEYRLASEDTAGAKKRTRVGKKTRIKRRLVAAKSAQRAADKQRRQAEEAAREAEKEEHLRRKKSEMNRKKQIRKREKERERRAAGLAAGDPGEQADSE